VSVTYLGYGKEGKKMTPELDKKLCDKYPKIFRDRHAPMTETCMCWGFEVGDGWYNILNNALYIIQWHIDESRKQRATDIQFNRVLKRAMNGDTKGLLWYYTYGDGADLWATKQVESTLNKPPLFRPVRDAIEQVVATQIKEKFGALRFYYTGGNDYIDGVVSMAESMSTSTCEGCGNPGTLNRDGWIRCQCEVCKKGE